MSRIGTGRIAIAPGEGDSFDFGGFGVVWKVEGSETGELFSVLEHLIAPRTLAAPLHRHVDEDEYSFVLEGTLGALLGEDLVEAGPGAWVLKPRGQWHTFWNPADTPCRIVEVISPAGFEHFFREVAEAFAAPDGPDLELFADACNRYSLEMALESVPPLCERFGLTSPLLVR
jgi:mannose-6-phosphate isomerase-like protein (cupin superfamily)